jgi:hypothetical protein
MRGRSLRGCALQTDHDHFCLNCQVYWGCSDPHCHLPTEERCSEHGGAWDTRNTEHIHECCDCDETDGEAVSTRDWTHSQSDCIEPRRWPCEKHRAATVSEASVRRPEFADPCSGGCGRFVVRPTTLCVHCAGLLQERNEREEAWSDAPKRLRVTLRALQCAGVVAGLVTFVALRLLLEPHWSDVQRHPSALIALIACTAICFFCYNKAADLRRRIFRISALRER